MRGLPKPKEKEPNWLKSRCRSVPITTIITTIGGGTIIITTTTIITITTTRVNKGDVHVDVFSASSLALSFTGLGIVLWPSL